MIDVSQALLDPARVFKKPKQVIACEELTRKLKIEILRRWEFDAHQMEVADEKAGMELHRYMQIAPSR